MKILAIIVNERLNIVGLTLEGKNSEFGKIGNGIETQNLDLREIMGRKFRNKQIDCSSGKIVEIDKFRLRDLPMQMLKNGGLCRIDNSIKLKTRLLAEGKLVGFEAEIAGVTKKISTPDIIKLTSWFKPDNFIVAVREDGGNKKPYISGKPGCAISGLPEKELGSGNEASKKAKTRTIQKEEVRGGMVANPEFDIIELFDIVSSLNGYVVKLPSEAYKKTRTSEVKTSSNFIPLGIGEVASAKVDYNEKSMNVNANFRKIGNIMIDFNSTGIPMPMPTYVVKKKSIFVNGENHMKKFGVVVGEAQVGELRKKFGASLAIEEVKDDSVVTPIRSMYGDPTLKMFLVDTDNIDVISKKKVGRYILSNKEVYKLQLELLEQKTIFRYVSDVNKTSKKAMADSGIADPRPKYGMYTGFSDVMLAKVIAAGIDVFTGIFTETEVDMGAKKDAAEKVASMVKTGEYKKEEDSLIEVDFGIKGLKTIPSVKDIMEKNKKAEKFLTPALNNIIDTIAKLKSVKEMFNYTEELKKQTDRRKEEIIKKLWLHKIACLSAGDYKAFKVEDKNDWRPMKASKSSNVNDYICNSSECELLTIKLTNVDLA